MRRILWERTPPLLLVSRIRFPASLSAVHTDVRVRASWWKDRSLRTVCGLYDCTNETRSEGRCKSCEDRVRECGAPVRGVRARSARISINSVFHVSITGLKLEEHHSHRSLIPQEKTLEKSTLEYKLDYHENLTALRARTQVLTIEDALKKSPGGPCQISRTVYDTGHDEEW